MQCARLRGKSSKRQKQNSGDLRQALYLWWNSSSPGASSQTWQQIQGEKQVRPAPFTIYYISAAVSLWTPGYCRYFWSLHYHHINTQCISPLCPGPGVTQKLLSWVHGSASFKVIYIINNSLTSFCEQQVDHIVQEWGSCCRKTYAWVVCLLWRLREWGYTGNLRTWEIFLSSTLSYLYRKQ